MPDIMTYTDYRKYLDDYQREAKKNIPGFSHRFFAQRAGFTSSGLLSNVITGRRNLTDDLLRKFATALKLTKQEEEYFEAMVRFNQAATSENRNLYYRRMLHLSPIHLKTIQTKKYAFYSHWWYSAIRELLNFHQFKDDWQALARKLDPPITVEQAKEAISVLDALGMVRKDSNGYYRQTDKLISTGTRHERSLLIQNYQLSTIGLAKESLMRHSPSSRHISTLTLTLSAESEKIARTEIEALQERLLKLAENDHNVDSVYQINMQLFPLTKRSTK